MATTYSSPTPGASLLLALRPPESSSVSPHTTEVDVPARHTALLINPTRLCAVRAFACLEAGFKVVVVGSASVGNSTRREDEKSDPEVEWRIAKGELACIEGRRAGEGWREWLARLARDDGQLLDDVAFVAYFPPLYPSPPASFTDALDLRRATHAMRIPLSVADKPHLSDFTWPATHRFSSSSSPHSSDAELRPSPLQLALTTNSTSCRLAARLRRDIVAKVPRSAGAAVEAIGRLRERTRDMAGAADVPKRCRSKKSARETGCSEPPLSEEDGEENVWCGRGSVNAPAPQLPARIGRSGSVFAALPSRGKSEDPARPPTPPLTPPTIQSTASDVGAGDGGSVDSAALARIRMRFIAQISEFWPLDRIAALSVDEEGEEAMNRAQRMLKNGDSGGRNGVALSSGGLNEDNATNSGFQSTSGFEQGGATSGSQDALLASRHGLSLVPPLPPPRVKGLIILVGSGPGDPSLLTLAAHHALTRLATLVLSDKLVPSAVLDLIPRRTGGREGKGVEVRIARKYPGGGEGGQGELEAWAVEAARKGEVVVRLKQGDPYVYGRGGDEVLYFRFQGFEPLVVPGLSSSLSGPLFAGIPVTQRGASEGFTVTTPVGRGGKRVDLPPHRRANTLVILMSVARLPEVVQALLHPSTASENGNNGAATAYPPYLPVAIVERASCADQRVVSSTLEGIVDALDRAGAQRPPGLVVVGWSVLCLEGEGEVSVLDDEDAERDDKDRKRVEKWLGGRRWKVREGVPEAWAEVFGGLSAAAVETTL